MKESKKNMFGIMPNIIIMLVQMGEFIPIVSRKPMRACGEHTDSINGYFRIAGTNLVWMHVQDGYGIIINEYVDTVLGRVNLIDILSQYYWFTDNNRGMVMCGDLAGRAIYRCIQSVILYGNIKNRMPRWLEVHHKWWRWCNTVNGIKSVCRAKHQHFHLFMNSKKSHQKGVMVWDSQSMEAWLKVIIQWDQYLGNVDM